MQRSHHDRKDADWKTLVAASAAGCDPKLMIALAFRELAENATSLVAGVVAPGESLELTSLMPSGGVIFSDGVEADALAFNAGAVARIGAAAKRTRLVVA